MFCFIKLDYLYCKDLIPYLFTYKNKNLKSRRVVAQHLNSGIYELFTSLIQSLKVLTIGKVCTFQSEYTIVTIDLENIYKGSNKVNEWSALLCNRQGLQMQFKRKKDSF